MTTLAQISETQANKATTVNENFEAAAAAGLYARRPAATSALTWGFYGGIAPVTFNVIADGTITLANGATNYIEANAAGTVVVNSVGWTAGFTRLYTATTAGSVVTAYVDYRTALVPAGVYLPISGGTLTGNLLFTDATYDIGATGATRPRDLFLSRNAVVGGTLGVTGISTFTGAVRGNGSRNWLGSDPGANFHTGLGGTFTGSTNTIGVGISGNTLTGVDGGFAAAFYSSPQIGRPGGGTTLSNAVNLFLDPPAFTGTGTVTKASTLYISGAPTGGSTNYAIDVAAGAVNFGGALTVAATIRLGGYTVATLPAGTAGMKAYVTDAVAPAFLTLLVGGGAAYSGAQYSGAAWVAD